MMFKKVFAPLQPLTGQGFLVLFSFEVVVILLSWHVFHSSLVPSPVKVASAFLSLWSDPDFWNGLISSMALTLKGTAISIGIALILSYGYFINAMRPIVLIVFGSRYLTLTGLIFLFTLFTNNGGQLKISLLIFGIVPFFVTSLVSILKSIDAQEFELCQTLKKNNWQAMWEVVIVGRISEVLEVIRQNFAISWLMITMVEGLSRSEGGLGVLLLDANKYLNLPKVFALLLVVFLIGQLVDMGLRELRKILFPYTELQVLK